MSEEEQQAFIALYERRNQTLTVDLKMTHALAFKREVMMTSETRGNSDVPDIVSAINGQLYYIIDPDSLPTRTTCSR